MVHSPLKRLRGFTLVEILLTLTIIIGILAVSFPVGLAFLNRYNLSRTHQILYTILQSTRQSSVDQRDNTRWGLYIDTTNKAFVSFSGDSYSTRDVSKDIITSYFSDISFTGSTATELVFEQITGSLYIPGTNITIQLNLGNLSKTISINKDTGLVRIDTELPAIPPTPRILDLYAGSPGAYSIRKLSNSYTGPAIRVRRGSDNTEYDIGFDSNGDLDTSAITALTTTSFPTLPLDVAPASVAFGTRRLRSAYSGPVIRVRKATDHRETDIGFDSNGLLDTAAIQALSPIESYSTNVLPLDVAPASVAFGTRRLRSAYSGPVIRVRKATDHRETDIGFDSNGLLDTAAIQALSPIESYSTNVLPLDVAPASVAFGTRRLRSAYSGPVIRVRKATDHRETDIGFDSNGLLDTAAIQALSPIESYSTNVLPLDVAPASVAFGTRRLRSAYSGPVIRVRKATDHRETDIGFDSNGLLDTAAIQALSPIESYSTNVLPLDVAPASVAFGTRRLRSAYSGPVIRVRKATDHRETDIGFDSNGLLDTAAIQALSPIESYSTNVLPLDVAPASVAFGTRYLGSSYTGPVVRIRRSSDNTELDFTPIQLTNGTLSSWIGSNNGFISIIYDQSGNNKHATQTTLNLQPQIVSSGTLTLSASGRPVFAPSSTGQFLNFDLSGLNNSANVSIFSVQDRRNGFSGEVFTHDPGCSNNRLMWTANASTTHNISRSCSSMDFYYPAFTTPQSYLASAITGSTYGTVAYSNSILTNNNPSAPFNQPFTTLGNSRLFNSYSGKLSELILYNSDQTTNRANIEGNIRQFYGIAHPTNTDVFISRVYDQSGNSKDATQPFVTLQPPAFSSGSFANMTSASGRPVFAPSSTGQFLNFDLSGLNNSANVSIFSVQDRRNGFSGEVFTHDPGCSNNRLMWTANASTTHNISRSCSSMDFYYPAFTTPQSYLASAITGSTYGTVAYSNSILTNNNPSAPFNQPFTTLGNSRLFNSYSGKLSELILYNSDQTTNRANIEGNIRQFYGIAHPTNTDVFISRVYDQSGNSKDATQPFVTLQPPAFSSGSFANMTSASGRPVFAPSSTGQFLNFDLSGLNNSANVSIFSVQDRRNGFSGEVFTHDPGCSNNRLMWTANASTTHNISRSCSSMDFYYPAFTTPQSYLASAITGSTYGTVAYSNSILTNNNPSAPFNQPFTTLGNSRLFNSYSGKLSELILYNSDQTTNRANIEGNIRQFYGIAHPTNTDVFISRVYDQSGNSKDATQPFVTLQPPAFSSGSFANMTSASGRPVFAPSSTGQFLNFDLSGLNNSANVSIFSVQDRRNGFSGEVFTHDPGCSNNRLMWTANASTTHNISRSCSSMDFYYPAFTTPQSYLASAITGSTYGTVAYSNSILTNNNPSAPFNQPFTTLGNSRLFNSYSGKLSELILYNSDQTTNRANIEGNIRQFYGIAHPTNTDVFISRVYDQSGNSKDATQPFVTLQPPAFSSGSFANMTSASGRPVFAPSSTGQFLNFDLSGLNNSANVSIFSVQDRRNGFSGEVFTHDPGCSNNRLMWTANASTTHNISRSCSSMDFYYPAFTTPQSYLASAITGSTYGTVAYSNSILTNNNPSAPFNQPFTTLGNSRLFNSYSGKLSELILYNSDQTTNRANIEGNIRQFYGIAHPTNTDVFISRVYDQSGNSKDATQPFVTLQPPAFSSGSFANMTSASGRPVFAPSSTGQFLNFDLSSFNGSTSSSFFAVEDRKNNYAGLTFETTQSGANSYIRFYQGSTNFYQTYHCNTDYSFSFPTTYSTPQSMLNSAIQNRSTFGSVGYANGLLRDNNPSTCGAYTGVGNTRLLSGYSGKLSELILYNSDQTTNRANIEGNILSYYGLYPKDIYVKTIYDQSGNANHATQTTLSRQPRITLTDGTIITQGSRPAIQFDGTDDTLRVPSITLNVFSQISAVASASNATKPPIFEQGIDTNSADGVLFYGSQTTYRTRRSSSAYAQAGITSWFGTGRSLMTMLINGTIRQHYRNGATQTIGTTTGTPLTDSTTTAPLNIFSRNATSLFSEGTLQELILWNGDQASNRTGIETYINSYFGIY